MRHALLFVRSSSGRFLPRRDAACYPGDSCGVVTDAGSRHRDPNGQGLRRWPAYRDEQRDRESPFGDRVEVGASQLDSIKLAFWEKYHAAATRCPPR